MSAAPFILDAREMRMLDGLRLNPRKSFPGRVRGERLTKKKGISIEFADFREYGEGDDLRHLDWNVLARLDNPVIRTYQDEEDLAVHVLLDCSASMDFGQPTKLAAAKEIASVFSYVALGMGDALLPRALGLREQPPAALRGRVAFIRFAAWLGGREAQGQTPVSKSLREFAGSAVRTGLCVVVTDGLDPEFASSIRVLSGRGHEVWLVQVLADEELDPDIEGDLRLIDAEAGEPVEITANSVALSGYLANMKAHNEKISAEVLRVGGRFTQVRSNVNIESLVKDVFRRHGWLMA